MSYSPESIQTIISQNEEIKAQLTRLDATIGLLTQAKTQDEIITRAELCSRLDISELTAIRWERKGRIPHFRIGSAVRYRWADVLKSLEKKT